MVVPVQLLLERVGDARRSGDTWSARCPAHDDRNASLSISEGEDSRALVKCHADCDLDSVLSALNLKKSDLFLQKEVKPKSKVIATYDYVDEAGDVLFQAVRLDPKDFRQRRVNSDGSFAWNMKAVRRVLYRLPELIEGVSRREEVFVVEGEKDVEALERAGHVATCSPMGAGKWKYVADHARKVLRDADVTVVADKDKAGYAHAAQVVKSLRDVVSSIRIVEAATGKDAADHLGAGHPVEAFVEVEEPATHDSDDEDEDAPKRSVASILVDLAHDNYTVVAAEDGKPWAIPLGGHVARRLRGTGGVGVELAAVYFGAFGKTAPAGARADAIAVLEGEALSADRVKLNVRVAQDGDRIVLDLGTPTGEVVIVTPVGWTVSTESPVLFRRSELTGALPQPERGKTLDALFDLLNVAAADRDVLVGWLVALLFEAAPRPGLFLAGEQGTGKSATARIIGSLVDAGPAPLRTAPRDDNAWVVTAAGSWVVVLDNVSSVPNWLSDALCRAVTGDALVRRQLYTDDDVSVVAIRRALVVTTIDAGTLRGDLLERLVPIELERITSVRRRTEVDLDAAWLAAHPGVLGALLDVVAEVLAVLPNITVTDLPRMADFGKILAAVDKVRGTNSLARYQELVATSLSTTVEGDPVAEAVAKFIRGRSEPTWEGTATELLAELNSRLATSRPPHGWPNNAIALGSQLQRLAPSLRADGISIDRDRSGRRRSWYLSVEEK